MQISKVYIVLSLVTIIGILSSCEDDSYYTPPPSGRLNQQLLDDSNLSTYQREVIEYFMDIALGFEFENSDRITRKWNTDLRVHVSGKTNEILLRELDEIINELEDLIIDDINIQIVDNIIDANFHIFFGTGDEYANLYPEVRENVSTNWGLFYLYWNGSQNLTNGHMYVNTTLANEVEQRHLLREEFTQSLGLARDSNQYPESIFQSSFTSTTTYEPIDRDIIRLLYHPRVSSGMSESRLIPVFIDILENESPD